MTSILKAEPKDFQLLADIGKKTFIESHGNSASMMDINKYVSEKYNLEVSEKELNDTHNIYHFIYYDEQAVGYSKIIFNSENSNLKNKNITKLERLYLLKPYYSLKLGLELLNFNIQLSKLNSQSGMWLFVWIENHRAFNFYQKTGFKVIGNYDFKISENHSNPNYQMFLKY
ncbi:MAG: GNAT family N-acetyltransferase [Saprospiraceae bacterium]|nr:GNAT family N-acetyltransferase [Saprospiraceae bacterium]MBK9726630.1 GNAT family N-acetyltransferase [Saprospiraceae bacterium]